MSRTRAARVIETTAGAHGDSAALASWQRLRRAAARRQGRRRMQLPNRLLVGAGSCGRAVGALAVLAALRQRVRELGAPVEVVEAGCTGMCHAAVQVTLQRPGAADVSWGLVEPEDAHALVAMATGQSASSALSHRLEWGHAGAPPAVPFLDGQRRQLLREAGRSDPSSLDEALVKGRYRGLVRALTIGPEAVIDAVRRAGLAGMGGAYFPTWRKWSACRQQPAPRYLLVNAEEGEPGVFKDRHLMEDGPHRLIEGLVIAAFAVGATKVYIFVNGQAGLARERMVRALDQAQSHGLIGEGVLGTRFGCSVELRDGAGGYVLGEESVIMEAIEGRKPLPRFRPPHAAERGLWTQPTVVNNVETLSRVPSIVNWVTGRSRGQREWVPTKLISISGDVERPGLVEVPFGTPLGDVVMKMAGGPPMGRALLAILTGGPSGNLVPPACLDRPLVPRDPEVMLGSGNLIALDSTRSLIEAVRRLTWFNADESCGKCTPCREGVRRLAERLDVVAGGEANERLAIEIAELSEVAAEASLCGLGRMAPNPVTSAARHFPWLHLALAGLS